MEVQSWRQKQFRFCIRNKWILLQASYICHYLNCSYCVYGTYIKVWSHSPRTVRSAIQEVHDKYQLFTFATRKFHLLRSHDSTQTMTAIAGRFDSDFTDGSAKMSKSDKLFRGSRISYAFILCNSRGSFRITTVLNKVICGKQKVSSVLYPSKTVSSLNAYSHGTRPVMKQLRLPRRPLELATWEFRVSRAYAKRLTGLIFDGLTLREYILFLIWILYFSSMEFRVKWHEFHDKSGQPGYNFCTCTCLSQSHMKLHYPILVNAGQWLSSGESSSRLTSNYFAQSLICFIWPPL